MLVIGELHRTEGFDERKSRTVDILNTQALSEGIP